MVANKAVNRLRAFAKWCVAEGNASPAVHASLCALAPLKQGASRRANRCPSARSRTMRWLARSRSSRRSSPTWSQHLVGMGGGELCAMTTVELDRSDSLAPGAGGGGREEKVRAWRSTRSRRSRSSC